jgi:hypothetical protein
MPIGKGEGIERWDEAMVRHLPAELRTLGLELRSGYRTPESKNCSKTALSGAKSGIKAGGLA